MTPLVCTLLTGLFRGAVFRHGGGARKQPVKQPTEMPTSTNLKALMGRFPSLMGHFSDLNGAFPRFRPKGPFYLFKKRGLRRVFDKDGSVSGFACRGSLVGRSRAC